MALENVADPSNGGVSEMPPVARQAPSVGPPPPTKPWLRTNSEFDDDEFFREYMAILAENRAIATAEAIAEEAAGEAGR